MPACKVCGHWFVKIKPQEELCDKCESALYRLSGYVAPVRHAKWVDNHCTACGMMPMGDEMWKNHDCEPPLFERFMDYCPSCGARMDGELNE